MTLLVVELGLETKGLALIICQFVGRTRLLLAFPLEVVQFEAMPATPKRRTVNKHRQARGLKETQQATSACCVPTAETSNN
jgi:hypothetical protein